MCFLGRKYFWLLCKLHIYTWYLNTFNHIARWATNSFWTFICLVTLSGYLGFSLIGNITCFSLHLWYVCCNGLYQFRIRSCTRQEWVIASVFSYFKWTGSFSIHFFLHFIHKSKGIVDYWNKGSSETKGRGGGRDWCEPVTRSRFFFLGNRGVSLDAGLDSKTGHEWACFSSL